MKLRHMVPVAVSLAYLTVAMLLHAAHEMRMRR